MRKTTKSGHKANTHTRTAKFTFITIITIICLQNTLQNVTKTREINPEEVQIMTTQSHKSLNHILQFLDDKYPNIARLVKPGSTSNEIEDWSNKRTCPITQKTFRNRQYFVRNLLKRAKDVEEKLGIDFKKFRDTQNFVSEFDNQLELGNREMAVSLCLDFVLERGVKELEAEKVCDELADFPFKLTGRNVLGYLLKRAPIIVVLIMGFLVCLFRLFETMELTENGYYDKDHDDE